MLKNKYRSEINTILSEYPDKNKRSAVMPLLYIAQQEYGYVTRDAIGEIASLLGIDPTQVVSIVGFYSLYYDKQEGQNRIQICTDLPCALRGSEQFADQVCEHLGVKMGETTEDQFFVVEEVMCLAACDKSPMFQVQNSTGISYHENQSLETVMDLTDQLRAEAKE